MYRLRSMCREVPEKMYRNEIIYNDRKGGCDCRIHLFHHYVILIMSLKLFDNNDKLKWRILTEFIE